MPDVNENLIRKIPPHSEEMENAVLGILLGENSEEAAEFAMNQLVPTDFYKKLNAQIFDAMSKLFRQRNAINVLTTLDKLKESESVVSEEEVKDYLNRLYLTAPMSTDIKVYVQSVRDKSTLRTLIATCDKISNDIYMGGREASDIFDQAESDLFTFLQNRRGVEEFEDISTIMARIFVSIGDTMRQKGRITGVPTGFIDLDDVLTGLHGSELILLAARPAMGKTAFALNIVANACIDKGYAAAIFSLEMAKEELLKRILAMRSGVTSDKIRTGTIDNAELEMISEAIYKISDTSLFVDDTPGVRVSDVRAKCRKIIREKGRLDLIVIDYLQLMQGEGRQDSRQNEVASISRNLKGLAKEFNVPILALSQLNRAAESREGHRPMMSDLRESGSIEQDADVILFIHREDYYVPDTPKKGIAEIIIAKQRNGATGTVELVWMGDKTLFHNKEKARNRVHEPD